MQQRNEYDAPELFDTETHTPTLDQTSYKHHITPPTQESYQVSEEQENKLLHADS
jgi:hypothetical protein